MIANTISRIIARVPRRSSTGKAAAQPDSCPALYVRLPTSPKHRDSTAHAKPISRSRATIPSSPRLNGFWSPAIA